MFPHLDLQRNTYQETLSSADHLPDLAFGQVQLPAVARLPEVQANWIKMLSDIGDRPGDDFLKVYWTSRWGRIQRGKLFDEWRERYASISPTATVELSADLDQAADRFAALEVPDHEVWSSFGHRCRRHVKTLSIFGARQMWPIILSALERFSTDQMERLLENQVAVNLRYQTVGRRRTGLLEITSARVAHSIFTDELNTPAKVWSAYPSIIPNDEEFLNDFTRYVETRAVRARYIMAELERADFRRQEGKEPEEGPSWENLTLEHVFPLHPSNEWSNETNADPDLQVDFVNRLGNLCLLAGRHNKEASGKGFEFKKAQEYSKSKLTLTAEIAKKYPAWDPSIDTG